MARRSSRWTIGEHGDADLRDIVASKAMLSATGYVDPERIGIIGGSYGGYMVLAALTLQPDAFRAGVDLFGISNWIRTLENMPPWWGSFRDALYAEMGDPEGRCRTSASHLAALQRREDSGSS